MILRPYTSESGAKTSGPFCTLPVSGLISPKAEMKRQKLTNAESYDEKSDAEEGDLIAGVELSGHALDVRGDD